MTKIASRIDHVPDDIDIYVGERLKKRRCLMGMSLQNLGKTCGVSFQQVQKYENGSNRISASKLLLMAQALNVPVSYFFEGAPISGQSVWSDPGEVMENKDKDQRSSPPHLTSDAKALSLLHHFGRIRSEDMKKKIIGIVKALADAAEGE